MATAMQVRAVRVAEPGGPGAMALETLELPAPGPGKPCIRNSGPLRASCSVSPGQPRRNT